MRNLHELDRYRRTDKDVIKYYGWTGDDGHGFFELPSTIDGGTLRVIASSSLGWDHVSVSRLNRCPNWPEMEQVKRLFFKDDEVAMQLHVPPADHISYHTFCLHIWRPHNIEIPLPPPIMVGPTTKGETSGR